MSGPEVDSSSIPSGSTRIITISNGAEIVLQNLGGRVFHEVEGTMSPESFTALSASLSGMPKAERDEQIRREIARVFKKLSGVEAVALNETDEVAYFTFLLPYTPELMSALKSLRFDHKLLINPVTLDRESLPAVRSMRPASEGLVARHGARHGTRDYSGLERVHAPEFVKRAQADIGGGAKVDGSSVRLGVTDTGITLNHPSFRSAVDGRNRVKYLKDFTREGRIYFSPEARFAATAPATEATNEDLLVEAQVLVTPQLPDLPLADKLTDVKGLRIKVSPELRKLLLDPASGARLGVLTEDSLQSDADPVDLNANGKLDDKLWAVLVPGKTPAEDALYFDASGTGDFRQSKRLSDFNASGATQEVFAETIGFHIQSDKLPKSDGKGTAEVRSASIVGYDPGNHGSHVSGIAAGSKTLANDSRLTLARGVAPEATLLVNRVCANNGGCGATQAFIDLATQAGADVINMSLGGLSPFNDGFGVQETMLNRLSGTHNTLFMVSAGNSGPGHRTVGSPSTARLALSIGATATRDMIQRQYQWPGSSDSDVASDEGDEDFMLFFSSRGPTAAGGFKPNLSAPGTELSAIQLNAAPGAHAGLDVYWGTSMAAPTAAGAYALLLDAVRKYNQAHPRRKLAADARILRSVLLESARAFDAATFDPATGAKTSGRYTWIDQGKGMIDLTAAWKKLFELRDQALPAAVTRADGTPVELDYPLIAPARIQGVAYDGTRAASAGTPAVGTGVFIDFAGTDTLRQVGIARRLPEGLAAGPEAGRLHGQLVTTADEFVLRTVIHGSSVPWVRAGVLDGLDCARSPTANLTVVGRGAELKVSDDGTGEPVLLGASNLNLCFDRQAIADELPAGDHGALISAYRVVDGKTSVLPSFIVPVYLNVPHRTLEGSAGYLAEGTVRSFDVSRNYIAVPPGTSLVRITLELPAVKTDGRGLAQAGESCAGVELMALGGRNTAKLYANRKDARVANCDASGAPVTDAAKRTLVFSAVDPAPGVWDVHVFGSYKYASSRYRLRADYVNSSASVRKIEGPLAALNGSLEWSIREASVAVSPDPARSRFKLSGLTASVSSRVSKDQQVIVPGPAGELRRYADEVLDVTVTTGGSVGNDIDLSVLECDGAATAPDASCQLVGASGGATDEESVTFRPKLRKTYIVRVNGYDIHDEGKFDSRETIRMPAEQGQVSVVQRPDTSVFDVTYSVAPEQIAASKLFGDELFTSGKYAITGSLTLRVIDGTLLTSISVKILP